MGGWEKQNGVWLLMVHDDGVGTKFEGSPSETSAVGGVV